MEINKIKIKFTSVIFKNYFSITLPPPPLQNPILGHGDDIYFSTSVTGRRYVYERKKMKKMFTKHIVRKYIRKLHV